jgi:hypothetical protein
LDWQCVSGILPYFFPEGAGDRIIAMLQKFSLFFTYALDDNIAEVKIQCLKPDRVMVEVICSGSLQ